MGRFSEEFQGKNTIAGVQGAGLLGVQILFKK